MKGPDIPAVADAAEAIAVSATGASALGEGTLQRQVEALEELLGLSRDRLDARTLADTERVLEQVAERRRLSLDHTVVALAGATGSGKSTLFNALAGAELSTTGVRRPTTGAPIACTWDPEGAGPLLDRLGIAPHHRYALGSAPFEASGPPRSAACGGSPGDQDRCAADGASAWPAGRSPVRGDRGALGRYEAFGGRREAWTADGGGCSGYPGGAVAGFWTTPGLVLLDLPDHDSAALQHRHQVDRLLGLVDAVVWVVDPEKYADAALHERYLRPLAGHAEVTAVVLNQADRLPGEVVDQVLDDLRRLLDEDGLALGEHGEPGAVVLAASALTGEGVAEVCAAVRRLAAERQAAGRRLAADVDRAARRLRPAYVGSGAGGIPEAAREEFLDRLADAVGVQAAGQSAERQWTAAARRACGVAWPRPRSRRAVPAAAAPAPVAARPVVEEAVRVVGGAASDGLPEPWGEAVRETARSRGRGLPEALEAAVARAWYAVPGAPRWWAAVRGVQRLLAVFAVLGVAWLAAVAAGAPIGLPRAALWVPALLPAVALLGGPLLALACGAVNRGAARRHGHAVEGRMRRAAADCGRRQLLDPLDAELLRYRRAREQYGTAASCRAA